MTVITTPVKHNRWILTWTTLVLVLAILTGVLF